MGYTARPNVPALLMHLTAVERLAAHVNTLPADFSRALGEDLEYARFGAALPELPWFDGLGLEPWFGRGELPTFTRLISHRSPMAFGIKASELVSNGALVGTEPGLAFVAGYFTQLCVTRSLEPLMQTLLLTHRLPGESPSVARSRIEWSWSLCLLQDLHGSSLVGTPAIRSRLQIRKRHALTGIGRGLYELMRVCSQEALGSAPSKAEVDGWMRGLSLFSFALGTPLGRFKGAAPNRELFRAPGIDVFAAVDQGLDHARTVLDVLGSMIRRNSFTARSRQRLLELCPEGSPEQVMRARAA